ncbi:expansin family protein [Sistotremastrum suecicum HHB10207 ss-3]|uniref:Expansin family protein n=1 Tax=Sistotremastrum suecicum HHB10207 ss-3 TaxID=1314776 RepID=A0A165ZNJ3_9AGAM|nr:expansin family protein [Sistotremastrum suecicum HHB10207 ss-3]
MFRIIAITFVLVASILSVLAAPATELEKRKTYNGKATWYVAGLGACGDWDDGKSNNVVALSRLRWFSGANCQQWVSIEANGQSTYALVRDECEGCEVDHIDLSEAAFQALADLEVGELNNVKWHFMPRGFEPW